MANANYRFNISPKVWTVLSQYAHIFVGAVTAQYVIHHTTNLKDLIGAGLGSLIPVIYRWANPADTFPMPNKGLVAADAAVMGTDTTK